MPRNVELFVKRRHFVRTIGSITTILAAAIGVRAADPIVLAAPDHPVAVVYVDAEADAIELEAAADLVRVLGIMSGQAIEVARVPGIDAIDATRPVLALGRLAEAQGLAMALQSDARDGYRIAVRDGRVLIAGESPRGVYHGVFALLEQLGCGWYAPLDIGEVIPRRETVTVASDLDESQVSDSIYRRFWYGGKNERETSPHVTWGYRNRGRNTEVGGMGTHGGLLPARELFETRPELFSYDRGRGERTLRQPCTTHPDTARVVADQQLAAMRARQAAHPGHRMFAAGPHDGYRGRCECDACMAMTDPDYREPSSGRTDDSDLLFSFVNRVAALTAREFPDNFLNILIYSDYSRVPRTIETIHPNVFPIFAPIRRCRLHGPGHPDCELAQLWQQEIQGWGRLTENLGFYIYNYNLADTLMPLNKLAFLRRLQKEVRDLGVGDRIRRLSWIFETIDSWAQHGPHLYLSVRLMWRNDVDLDAEFNRFIDGFYGAAADPMRRYWLGVDAAYEQADVHVGSAYGQHRIWTDAVLETSREAIEEAGRLAANDRERDAVAMASAGLRCAELFVGIRRAINDGRFRIAHRLHRRLKEQVDMMAAAGWAHDRYAWGYYNRFIGRTVEGGAAIVRNGGQVLVQMPDAWKFATDEQRDGVARGVYRPDHDDDAWRELRTYTDSWIDQGLLWYRGQAWYRTVFTMPPVEADADLRLWFGGFDESVDVYLNGHHLGERRGFATPAEFADIRQHLNPGGRNVLAVRVTNDELGEIGTGGIMMPVIIYRAGDGEPPEADEDQPEPDEADYIIG